MKDLTKVQQRHTEELVKSLRSHVWKDYEIVKAEKLEHTGNISITLKVDIREDQDHSQEGLDLSGLNLEKYQRTASTGATIIQEKHYGVTYSVQIQFRGGAE